ncbi:hypothetical protein OTU49_006464, partial [Cherax quadricarinatus]
PSIQDTRRPLCLPDTTVYTLVHTPYTYYQPSILTCIKEAYSNSQGERLAEDPPVESFLSFMQIKEEPQDISVLTGTGEVASPHPELLSCTDTDDFSSCVCPPPIQVREGNQWHFL